MMGLNNALLMNVVAVVGVAATAVFETASTRLCWLW